MGADFVFAVCKLELTKEQAYIKARELTMEEQLTETATYLANECGVELEDNEIFTYLKECIDLVYSSHLRRDTGQFRLKDIEHVFVITGGMTWGDSPTDAFQSYNVCEVFNLTVPFNTP